jgi:formamidopyrimidine-DNA glycosylase
VLATDLTAFRTVLTSESHTLKRALTDPHLFGGIGNAYSDEILHRARLSPITLTGQLEDAEIACLYEATRAMLTGSG